MLFIYLDQNKWIDLAKAASGRPDGSPYSEILKKAQQGVRDGRVCFPLSSVHMIETAKSPRQDQRTLLANLMTELSQGVVLRAEPQLINVYLDRASLECFGEEVPPAPTPFGRGIEAAFDLDVRQSLHISDKHADLLRRILDTPRAWTNFLSFAQENERLAGIQSVRKVGERAAAKSESARAMVPMVDLDLAHRAYAVRLTMNLLDRLRQSLHRVGRTFEEWGALGPDRLMRFWRSIPLLDVEIELHTQMHREKSKPWAPNDVLDIGSLSLAVPSCDVVVTERFWVSLIRRRGLDVKYNTKVLPDLADIIDIAWGEPSVE